MSATKTIPDELRDLFNKPALAHVSYINPRIAGASNTIGSVTVLVWNARRAPKRSGSSCLKRCEAALRTFSNG